MNWWIFLIIGMALIGVIGDFFIKISGDGPTYISWKWFILGFTIYALTAVGWFFAFKHVKVSTLGVFYALSTVLFLVMLGVFYFKESLNSYEIAGVGAAVVAIILLGRFA
jgi:drug/metabolite transporter (DMT)-like permease